MSNVTQRQLIEQILDLQKSQGKMQLNMSSDISILKNDIADQKVNYQKVIGYLENDSKTNTKGVVQLANDNKIRLDKKDKVDAVRVGKAGLISVAAGFIGGVIIFLAKSLMK